MKYVKKYTALILTAALCMQLAGCGLGQSHSNQGQNEGKMSYVTEEVTLPQYLDINTECISGNTLYYAAFDYDAETQMNASAIYALNLEEEQPQPVRFPASIGKDEYVQQIAADKNGVLYVILSVNTWDVKTETSANAVVLKKLDGEGNELQAFILSDYFRGQEYTYIAGMAIDDDGNIYLSDGANTITALDADGKLLFQETGDAAVLQLVCSKNGTVIALLYSGQGVELRKLDANLKGFGQRYDISQIIEIPRLASGTDADLLISSGSTAYDYDMDAKKLQEKWEWLSLNIVTDYNCSILSLADGRVLCLNKIYSGDYENAVLKTELNVIRAAREGEIENTQQKVLTYGGISLFIEPSVREAIVNYNKSNPEYRIEIKEYGKEDIQEGYTQLNLDIVSGNCPDIIALPVSAGIPLESYIEKGLLEDMYPYIDQDEILARSDFVENILKAFETDGKLYGIPLSFQIYTMLGKTSLLGERSGWTLDEMISFADTFPMGSPIFEDASKSGVFNICKSANIDQLVSRTEEGYSFDRALFIKMLQFANRFTDDDKYVYEAELVKRIQEDELLLLDLNISGVLSHQFNCALFGEEVSYIGYPSGSRAGNQAGSMAVAAITAKCRDKAAAWEFVRTLLTEEYQSGATTLNAFSIRKDSLEKQFEEAMEVLYAGEKGNSIEQPKGTYGIGDMFIDVYAASEEEVAILRGLIASVTSKRSSDKQINAILDEEAQSFFKGTKTAEETADIVENRIRTYLEELR